MTVVKLGDHITAKCGRCNDITGHVIMLILDGAIARVECRSCGSMHKYREHLDKTKKPSKVTSMRHVRAGNSREEARDISSEHAFCTVSESADRQGASTYARKQVSSRVEASRRAAAAKIESAWQEAMSRCDGKSLPVYSMQNDYSVRALVEHPVFGKGEVIKIFPPDKMEVLFQEGVKLLRCKL